MELIDWREVLKAVFGETKAMTINRLIKSSSFILLVLGSIYFGNALAEPQSADKVIDEASRQILDAIDPRKDELRKDSAKLYKLVEDIIVPHFDFDTISRRVLGKAWNDASDEQRKRFSDAFKNLLVRTYSTALLEYSGEEINWQTLKKSADAQKVVQQAEVTLASGQTIPMKWGLHKVENTWKVYDINIDGISLVTNYRSVFASEVRKNGLDALILRLEEKNKTS